MQLGLFDNIETKKRFTITECESDYEYLETEDGHIENTIYKELTKQELMDILAKSDKNEKHKYAWSIYYQENNKHWVLLIVDGGIPMSGGSTAGFDEVKRYIDSIEWEDL